MRFLRSIIRENKTEADGTITVDLPTNPLSHIVFTLKMLNLTAHTKATLAQMLGAVEKVEVLHRGSAVMSLSGADLYALNCVLLGHEPWQENVINTENATRALTMMIPFGQKLYDVNQCLFGTKKGELQLKITLDIADTGYDGLITNIETVELLGASPADYLKVTTLNKTAVVGDFDVDLPIGNPLLGILLYSTTVMTGTAWTNTINKIKLLIDNSEAYYSKCIWQSLHGDFINIMGPAGAYGEKIHDFEDTAGAIANVDTKGEEQVDTALAHYALLDFGIAVPKEFILESAGLSRLHLKLTGEDTNAVRVLPIEKMSI